MQVDVRPYNDQDAFAVISRLDLADQMEVELTRGAHTPALTLWAEWRAAVPQHLLSFVAHVGGVPFAIFALVGTGEANAACAAMLARDHRHYRRPLTRLARMIRAQIPPTMAALGINRIECRCWSDHPTAAQLLRAVGFSHEIDLPGFGRTGQLTFRQFAWLAPAVPPKTNQE